MIFVTLGTQDKSFKRLLEMVDKAITEGYIKDKVIVQAGVTKYSSDRMDIYNLLPIDKFNKYIEECDLLITHGGVGSILNGLKNNKKVIVMPRLLKYDEHESDHQIQIVNTFYEKGYILKVDENDDLGKIINESKKFKPNKYIFNNEKFVKLIDNMLGKWIK